MKREDNREKTKREKEREWSHDLVGCVAHVHGDMTGPERRRQPSSQAGCGQRRKRERGELGEGRKRLVEVGMVMGGGDGGGDLGGGGGDGGSWGCWW